MSKRMERTRVVGIDVPVDAGREITIVVEHDDGSIQYIAVEARAMTEKIASKSRRRRPTR